VRKRIYFVLMAAMVLLIASAVLRAASAQTKSSGLLLKNHPLVDRIWDQRNAKWITPIQLETAIKNTTFVLLGETHDNAAHHLLQSRLLDALINAKRKPALVMEQFDVEHQRLIDGVRERSGDAEAIADAGQMAKKRWGWPQYKPLVSTAVTRELPVMAANLSRAEARKVFADGLKSLPPPYDEKLFASTWNAERNAIMRAIMIESHCGQLVSEMEGGMIAAQRARDAVMANVLVQHHDRGAVLIAGRGHVRRDLGVPLYLSYLLSDRKRDTKRETDYKTSTLAVGFVEVDEGKTTPADYKEIRNEIRNETEPPFDYVWFTARQIRDDPCKGMTLTPPPPPPAPVKPAAVSATVM
jgi:uncharacterized iron-regulated protein